MTASPGSTVPLCVCLVQKTAAAPVEKKEKKEGYFHSSHLLDQIQACFDEQHACTAGAGRRWHVSIGEEYVLAFVLCFVFHTPHASNMGS